LSGTRVSRMWLQLWLVLHYAAGQDGNS
jgi:hypothetical protein